MDVKAKYLLYSMLYGVIYQRLNYRGRSKTITPWHLHEQAFQRANYILAAIGESLSEEEIAQVLYEMHMHEVEV